MCFMFCIVFYKSGHRFYSSFRHQFYSNRGPNSAKIVAYEILIACNVILTIYYTTFIKYKQISVVTLYLTVISRNRLYLNALSKLCIGFIVGAKLIMNFNTMVIER